MDALPRTETLDRHACLELLAQASVGRLVYAVPAGPPGVVPVSYLLECEESGEGSGEGSVVVRTARGSRLGEAAPGAAVSFEVDEIDVGTHEGWSVVVSGVAEQVHDPEDVRRVAGRLTAWVPGVKDLFLRVPLEHVTGRRVLSRERVVQLPGTPAPRWRAQTGWTPATRTPADCATDFDGR